MSHIENTIVARFEKAGEKFEVLVDPKKGYEYKIGTKKDFANVLVFDEVFKDANKGDRHTSAAIQKAFGTTDVETVAKKIIAQGELQLTTDQRRKLTDEKRLKVIDLMMRNCADPRTKAPHPRLRLENALDEARFHFDAFKSTEEQMKAAIEAIREIIPISMENVKIAVKVPAEFAAKCYGALREYGMAREEYGHDGSLLCVCEMPVGLQGEFFDKINKLTGGAVQTKKL